MMPPHHSNQPSKPSRHRSGIHLLRMMLACVTVLGLIQCDSIQSTAFSPEESADIQLLTSMTWQDALALSPQSLVMEPQARVTGDRLEVMKTAQDGRPTRVRVNGRVFVELQGADPGKALCQQAYLTEDEIILRGKPLITRGNTVIQGLSDFTVFYLRDNRLRVIGMHRIIQNRQLSGILESGPGARDPGSGFEALPGGVLPMPVRGDWSAGPNPILPPLTLEDVPADIRQPDPPSAPPAELIPNPISISTLPVLPPLAPLPPQVPGSQP